MPTRGLQPVCQSPVRQEFPGGNERSRSVKHAVTGQEDGNGKGEGRENATKCKRKYVKQCRFSFPNYVEVLGNGALARRRECRNGQRVAFLQHSGCKALVLDGTKRPWDVYLEGYAELWVYCQRSTDSRAAREQQGMRTHRIVGMVPSLVTIW